jgi:hypothetical protein
METSDHSLNWHNESPDDFITAIILTYTKGDSPDEVQGSTLCRWQGMVV